MAVNSLTVTLALVLLSSGRDIELTHLEIASTYGNFLDGYPFAQLNDLMLTRLANPAGRSPGATRIHVIEPTRTNPTPDAPPGRFGPVELLPAVRCTGTFVSHPVDEDLDPVLYRSRLIVIWFQEDAEAPLSEFVTAAVAQLPWDELAEDSEV